LVFIVIGLFVNIPYLLSAPFCSQYLFFLLAQPYPFKGQARRFLYGVLSGPSNYTQNNCDDSNYNQDVNDAAGVETAKKANGPNDDQNDCDGIK